MSTNPGSSLMEIFSKLRLPLICAPMLRVSGLELVRAACSNNIIGAFPTANARDDNELESWLKSLKAAESDAQAHERAFAPYCPNLIMRSNPNHLHRAIELFIQYGTKLVITSVGSPAALMPDLKAANIKVLADVASLRHAEKALEAGVDGLILLTAGAGGKTGWANPFAFVRAVRHFYDGPIVLAGGLSDGISLHAARVLGCTVGYMGTRFIATRESMAQDAYKEMLVASSLDNIVLTNAITGTPTSWLGGSIENAGLDIKNLPEKVTPEEAQRQFGYVPGMSRPARWKDIWSAGHSVSGVDSIPSVAALVAQLENEYITASQIRH